MVYDYGGETNASVEAGEFESDPPIRIPIEQTQGQRLPQAGWLAWRIVNGQAVSETVSGAGNAGDDSDAGPGTNQHVGDGLSRHDEYRGFVIGGQHRRLNPGFKDLFVASEVPEGLGSAPPALSALSPAMSVWQIDPNEMETDRRVNRNSLISVYLQYGLEILHFEDDPMLPPDDIVYGRIPINQASPYRGPRRVTGPIEVFTFYIRLYSPPTPDGDVPDMPVDTLQRSKTIAHEIGHGIEMLHDGATCFGSSSIMRPGAPPSWMPNALLCWDNIPTTYDSTNVNRIQLRSW